MNIAEKVSYIKGLAEGMNIGTDKPEAKLITEIIEVLGLISEEIETIEQDVVTAEDYLDEIDSDLGDLEEYVYGDDDEYCDGDCENCDEDDEDGDYYEITCPNCGEVICFDDSIDMEGLECPACGKKIDEK